MQTQGGTCLPSGTSPDADADAAQPVSVTMHSGTPLLIVDPVPEGQHLKRPEEKVSSLWD